jgi:hypothetical protein
MIKNEIMKSKIIISLTAVLLITGLSGCYKDIIDPGPDPNGPPQAVSFKSDLVPIFATNCALSGCHDGLSHNPALTADKAYSAITSGGYISTTIPSTSILYAEIKSGSMPPTGALKPTDVQKIYDWIRNGAPNN